MTLLITAQPTNQGVCPSNLKSSSLLQPRRGSGLFLGWSSRILRQDIGDMADVIRASVAPCTERGEVPMQ